MVSFENEIERALEIIDIRQRYEYVYDAICDYLDKQFKEKNYCDFKDDMCIVNRNGVGKNKDSGCCYSFRLDFFLNMRDKKRCKYLGDKECKTKCISCKLYVCKYLAKKGVRFSPHNFKGISKVFDDRQIEVMQNNCFRTQEEIIDKLLEVKKSRMPYFLFSLFNRAKIKQAN
jgi:hypothetical protein